MKYSKSKPLSTGVLLIFSLSLLMILISVSIQIFKGFESISGQLNQEIKLYVYLEDSVNVSNFDSLKNTFALNRLVDNSKSEISLSSKDQIAKDFLRSSHEDYQELLGDENPFKNLITINLKQQYKISNKIDSIATQLRSQSGIYEVTYPSSYLNILITKTKQVSLILGAILLFILLLTYFQILNYIRLIIHSNRTIIKSMQLLGSTDSYIKKPYLLDVLKNVIIGAIIGVIILNGIYFYIGNSVPELNSFLFSNQNILWVFGLSFLTLLVFSMISTIYSLNRYLNIQRTNLF
jgi:cell division transport system permease protein